jgi:hypothetical protein
MMELIYKLNQYFFKIKNKKKISKKEKKKEKQKKVRY